MADVVPRLVVLPPEFAGASGYLDDVGGGHTFTLDQDGHALLGLRIGADCTDAYSYLTIDAQGYKPYVRHGVLIRAGRDRQIRVGVAPDPSRQGDTLLPAVEPLLQTVSRALVGPLRVVHHPTSGLRTHSYADDTGPRRVLFCSWFCALRDWRDNQSAAGGVLDRVVTAGYQGIRILRVLGESDTSGYFAGRAVLPEWSIQALVGFGLACQARGLRLQLSCGRQWGTSERMAWETRCAQALQAAGLAQTIALWEGDNEYWQNAPMRDSDEQIAFYGQLFAMVRSTLRPAPLCACGAPPNENPEALYRASTHSDILEKHGMRDEDRCVKRAFTPNYWEGDPGHFPLPMWEGEPKPHVHPDAFMGTTSQGRIVATLAMNQLVGNAVTFFSGEAVRGRDPSIAPGFSAVPLLLNSLPEDIATWGHVSGGNIWWWQGPGKKFATVCDGDFWGPSALAPPQPIAWSTIIGPEWDWREGGTTPTIRPGEGAALIVGEFV
jgi:hypothetical protein